MSRHVRLFRPRASLLLALLGGILLSPCADGGQSAPRNATAVPQTPAPPETPPLSLDALQHVQDLLNARKQALDEREQRIAVEEERWKAVKAEVERLMAQYETRLKTEQDKAKKAMLNQKNPRSNARQQRGRQPQAPLSPQKALTKIYETMPPEEAALRLEKMPIEQATLLLSAMKQKTAGAILAAMPPEKAAELTEHILAQSPPAPHDDLGAP